MTPLYVSDDVAFIEPLWLLLSVVLFIATALWRRQSLATDWRKVVAEPVLSFLGNGASTRRQIDLSLLCAAIVALALSEPSLRQHSDDTWRHSIGWIAVADVSRSMTLDDVAPDRFAAMRAALRKLSNAAGARPIALILFAGDAFLVVPPAFDRSFFNEHVARLEHGVIPIQGSNAARALSLATAVAEDSGMLKARIFLLGDSGGTNRRTVAAARYLSESGHQLDVLLFGQVNPNAEQPLDMIAAQSLAAEGGGIAVKSNSLGVIPFDELALSASNDAQDAAELQSLIWAPQSHWLLMILLPVVLRMFRSGMTGR